MRRGPQQVLVYATGPAVDPLKRARPRPNDPALEVQKSAQVATKQKRVAIVDDEESIRGIYSIILGRLGYEIDFLAKDGNECVKNVLELNSHPDLIIMDYRMPEMDGLEASALLLKQNPRLRIIIASADDSIQPRVESLGMIFLQKPFYSATLSALVGKAFE